MRDIKADCLKLQEELKRQKSALQAQQDASVDVKRKVNNFNNLVLAYLCIGSLGVHVTLTSNAFFPRAIYGSSHFPFACCSFQKTKSV